MALVSSLELVFGDSDDRLITSEERIEGLAYRRHARSLLEQQGLPTDGVFEQDPPPRHSPLAPVLRTLSACSPDRSLTIGFEPPAGGCWLAGR